MNQIEVLKIVVNDHIYAEYGLEKEIILKAIEMHKIYDDNNFNLILEKLSEYQSLNDSFLNI